MTHIANLAESVIVDKMQAGELGWWDLFRTLHLLEETISVYKELGEPPPDGVAASALLIANILSIANDRDASISERKNALWRTLGLGKLTTDPKVRNIALAGCMEIMRRMGKSETDIEGSAEFQLLGIPANAFMQARQEPVAIPDHYGEQELPYFIEQLALFQQDLPNKGPSES